MSLPNGEVPGQGNPGPMDHLLIGPVAVPEDSPEYLAFAAGGESAGSDGAAGDQAAAGTEIDGGDGLSDDTRDTQDDGTSDQESTGELDAAADDADLEQYPEKVREAFKGLSREQRRALYEHAESSVTPKLEQKYEADRQTAAELQAKAERDEAEQATIRNKFGSHFGTQDVEIKDRDGNVTKRPSYDETVRLLTTRNGDDILDEKYGMSVSEAHDWKDELDSRRELAPALSKHFDDLAWGKLGKGLHDGLKSIDGLDADALVNGAQGPGEVIGRLHSQLTERHTREVADLKDGYEKRIRALSLNGEALKGQAAAGSGRRLETGGMTGNPGGEMSLEEYARLTPEQQAKLTPQQIDRFTQRLLAKSR